MTEIAAVVVGECNIHPTVATTRISAKNRKKDKLRNKAEIRSKTKTEIAAKNETYLQEEAKSGTIIKKDVCNTAPSQEEKSPEKPDETYRDILALPENGEISLKIKPTRYPSPSD